MANRHLSRSIVLQTLFEWDFSSKDSKEVTEIFKRNVREFAPGHGDFSFMENLLSGVLDKQKDIDLIIEKAAPDWPIDKISIIDRNILRIRKMFLSIIFILSIGQSGAAFSIIKSMSFCLSKTPESKFSIKEKSP